MQTEFTSSPTLATGPTTHCLLDPRQQPPLPRHFQAQSSMLSPIMSTSKSGKIHHNPCPNRPGSAERGPRESQSAEEVRFARKLTKSRLKNLTAGRMRYEQTGSRRDDSPR